MKKILFLLIVFGMSLNGPHAFSQEKTGSPPLTLEDCIQLALKNRPELEMATLDILNAEYQIKETTSYYYPRLNLNAGYTRFNRPEDFNFDNINIDVSKITEPANVFLSQYGITLPTKILQSFELEIGKTNWFSLSLDLNQPLYTFGRIKEGVNQARIGHSIATNQKEKKRGEIILEVKKGYYQFILVKEIQQLMKEAEARASVVAKMVKIAYETSIPEKEDKGTTRIDYLKAENFYSEMKIRLSETNKNVKLAELALKMTMGIITEQPLNLSEVSLQSIPMTLVPPGSVKDKVREGNIDLKNLDLGVQLFDSKRRGAKKEYLPKIGLQGQYLGPEDRYGTPNVWYLGIGITMPLFDGFLTKAKVGQAEAQFRKANSQKVLLESALSVQVDHLHSTLTELRERVNILQGAIKDALERTQLAADGYAAGITEYDELLLAQKTELEMRSAYIQSLYLYQTTQSEIEFISGGR
jgi:outer membrane protein TolC